MFLPLTKIESQNIKVIGDKKSVLNLKLKIKLVKLYKLCFCFTNHTCLKVFIISNDVYNKVRIIKHKLSPLHARPF